MSKKHYSQHKKEITHKKEIAPEETTQQPILKEKQHKKTSWKHLLFSETTLIVLLLLIAITISTVFRMYPSSLQTTNTWAQATIENQIKSNVAQQVAQQFPHLPQTQRDEYVNKQLQDVLQTQKATIDTQQKQLATQFKSRMQDEHNNTYLLAIDPYVWLSYARNLETYGHFGNEIVNNTDWYTLRNGRFGSKANFHLHPYLTVQVHKFLRIFNPDITLERAAFLMPVLIIILAIIAAFFLGRKISGNVAGFVAGLIIALNTALLGRTPAGFSDTDAYLIFFPLLISWMYLEVLTSKTWKRRTIFLLLSTAFTVLFSKAWTKWWYIVSILMAMTAIYFVYTLYIERKKLKKLLRKPKQLFTQTRSGQTIIDVLAFFAILLVLASIFYSSVGSPQGFFKPLRDIIISPLGVLNVKSVATANIWPNVLTTVAELNAGSWGQIIGSLGGRLFFIIGALGVLLTFFLRTKEDTFEIRYAALLVIWFFGLSLVGVMSSRFIALLAAPFAIAFGVFFGILWTKGSELLSREVSVPMLATKIGIAIIILLLFIAPIKAAHTVALNEVPSMNDGWYTSLITIQQNCSDGIITSWWDFGHWFTNIAQRRVTFDGGDQGKRIYWVGKSLMTDNATENKDILRMLNCGQNKGYEILAKKLNDSYQATQLINKIAYETKSEAKATLQHAALSDNVIVSILNYTHCSNEDLLDQYYIVSQDMIGKSNVWAHFGDWNFSKAYIYYLSKHDTYDEAVKKMQDEIGISKDTANKLYFDATSLNTNREVDTWISPWPSYITINSKACEKGNETITCTINQKIGEQQGQSIIIDKAIVPLQNVNETKLTVIASANGIARSVDPIIPKAVNLPAKDNFVQTRMPKTTFPYELTIGKTADGTYRAILSDSILARSTFTKLFYFDGLYMNDYTKLSDITTFRGERIIVYKVNLTNKY